MTETSRNISNYTAPTSEIHNISIYYQLRMNMNLTFKDSDNIFHYDCSAQPNTYYDMFLNTCWFYLDMAVYFILPLITMSLSFVFILSKINKSNKNYLSFLFKYKANSKIYKKKIRKNKRMITSLFFINLYFFLSTMPYFVFNIVVQRHGTYYFLDAFVNILFYSNNAFSIFLFGLNSNKFRQTLRFFLDRILRNR